MKLKSLSLRVYVLIGGMVAATILMGMVKAPQPNPLATEFTQIMERLPQAGQNIVQLRNGLNTVNTLLKNNQLPQALNVLQDIKLGALKNLQFSTDFGNLPGNQVIDIYFGDFMNNLHNQIQFAATRSAQPEALAQPPAPQTTSSAPAAQPIEINSPAAIREHLAEVMKNLPQTGANIPRLREALEPIRIALQEKQPNLPNILGMLEKIENGPLKNLQFSIPDSEPITGSDFLAMNLGGLIGMIQLEIQARQPHIAGQPFGLINRQNSCFMNASIQALASLDKLTHVLLSHAYDDYYKPDSIAAAYINLLKIMQTQKTAIIDPLPFCLLGWEFFPEQKGRQQDASEFIVQLLNAVAENDVNPARNPQRINQDVVSLFQIKSLQAVYEQNNTRRSSQYISDLVLQAPIQAHNATLLHCLEDLFKVEYPEGTSWRKITKISEVSNYFLVRLIRETSGGTKNAAAISFPLDNLNISSLALKGAWPLYRCKAFIVHVGQLNAGHYTAYIRMGQEWFLCDDTNVTPIATNEVQDFANKGVIDSVYGAKLTPVMFFYEQQ